MGTDKARARGNPWETDEGRETVAPWEKLEAPRKVQTGGGMERVREGGRSWSPVRAACSRSPVEPAP